MDNNKWQELGYSPAQNLSFGINGWLSVKRIDAWSGKEKTVFEGHNMIVDEGKGALMDLLASDVSTLGYDPVDIDPGAGINAQFGPFDAIVCTKTDTSVSGGDTWVSSVWDDPSTTGNIYHSISYDGVLHAASQNPGWNVCAITHPQGSLAITLSATMPADKGNKGSASYDNWIKSVVVAMNVKPDKGYDDTAYGQNTGDERVFARVRVGELEKTTQNAFQFTWTFTMTTG